MPKTFWPNASDPMWKPVVEEIPAERLAEMYKSLPQSDPEPWGPYSPYPMQTDEDGPVVYLN